MHRQPRQRADVPEPRYCDQLGWAWPHGGEGVPRPLLWNILLHLDRCYLGRPLRRHLGRRRRLLVRLRRLIVDVVILESFRVGADAPVPSIVLAVEVAAPSVVPFG
jgi:hypothetical protein